MLLAALLVGLFALLQTYAPVSPLGALAAALLVPVIGFISTKLYDGIKTIVPWYDRLPAIVHQIAAPVFGLLFGWITAATGAAVLTDIHGATAGWFGAVLNALAMAGIKRWEKAKAPVDTTVTLEATRMSSGHAQIAKTRPRAARGSGTVTGMGGTASHPVRVSPGTGPNRPEDLRDPPRPAV